MIYFDSNMEIKQILYPKRTAAILRFRNIWSFINKRTDRKHFYEYNKDLLLFDLLAIKVSKMLLELLNLHSNFPTDAGYKPDVTILIMTS